MTDRRKRKITPELRDIPLTFIDCGERGAIIPGGWPGHHWCMSKEPGSFSGSFDCEENLACKTCPRGYTR